MRVMLYGEAAECQQAVDTFHSYLPLTERSAVCIQNANDREAFQKQIIEWDPNLIIVLADRANGMEVVYTAKETRSDIPVFWFSDDEGFGMQSYRLRCDYFAVKPITVEKLKKAFRRCAHIGIRINGLPALP